MADFLGCSEEVTMIKHMSFRLFEESKGFASAWEWIIGIEAKLLKDVERVARAHFKPKETDEEQENHILEVCPANCYK
jgi:hypothetical protein